MTSWSGQRERDLITKALSPAKVLSVILDEADKIARVIVPTDQMSLAIGKEGQNARLAYKLTHWKIDVKDTEALKAQGEDLINKARAAALAELPDAFIRSAVARRWCSADARSRGRPPVRPVDGRPDRPQRGRRVAAGPA